MLNFENAWRYESPGAIANEVEVEFLEVIRKIAHGDQNLLEHFKKYFAYAAGSPSTESSSANWADSDLSSYMGQAAENAPLFIEAFYDACEKLKIEQSLPVPDITFMNKVLTKYQTNYKIEPPNLIFDRSQITAPNPDIPKSFDQNAQELIQKSLQEGKDLMIEGKHRLAVQEVLWLLETVTTGFQALKDGEHIIEGKYFNKIIDVMRRNNQGTALEQIVGWITKLHGFLSVPSGGGIRHGMHLKEGVATSDAEAKLYYNLIVSYISFLLSEYERLKGKEDNQDSEKNNDW